MRPSFVLTTLLWSSSFTTSIYLIYSSKSALVLHAWKRSRVTGDYACGGREVFGPSAQWSLWYAHHITRRVFPATSTAAAGIATAGIATTGAKG